MSTLVCIRHFDLNLYMVNHAMKMFTLKSSLCGLHNIKKTPKFQVKMHCLGHQQKLFASSSHLDIHRHPDLHHGSSQHLHVQHRLLPRGGLQGLLRRSRQLQSHMPASAVHCPQLHVGISGRGRISKNAYYDQEPFALRHGLSLHPAN